MSLKGILSNFSFVACFASCRKLSNIAYHHCISRLLKLLKTYNRGQLFYFMYVIICVSVSYSNISIYISIYEPALQLQLPLRKLGVSI